MNQNTKDNILENQMKKCTDEFSMGQKIYSTPSITTIGQINKITLAGGLSPVDDSGSTFTVS